MTDEPDKPVKTPIKPGRKPRILTKTEIKNAKPKTGRPPALEKRFKKITIDDVRIAYMTWEWETQEELAKAIGEKFGEKISGQYISKMALRYDWHEARVLLLAGTGPKSLASIQTLKREAEHFDALDCLKGFQSRLLKRIAGEVASHPEPEFFKGMMDVYHSVQKAIGETFEYKLRQQNVTSPPSPSAPAPKPEIKEGVPTTISANIAAFHKRK